MKVCHVVFSTNRLEFLEKTFEANKKFDFTGLEVHHLFIDDYPLGRDNDTLYEFVTLHGYDEIILHKENLGITDFGEDSQDYTKWEIVDKVSNVYNRLILFRGNLFHSSLDYFGSNLQNGRLFQTFFFNTKY